MTLPAIACLTALLALPLAAAPPAAQPAPRAGNPRQATPLTLDASVNLALDYNPLLRAAQARIEEARGQAIQAGLYPNPRQDGGNPNQLGGSQTLWNVGITQVWVRGGKLRLARAAAEQEVRQTELALVRQRFDLLTSVRIQFYVTLAAQERVVAIKELYDLAARAEQAAIQLERAGQGTAIDRLLLSIERQRAESELRSIGATLAGARQQLVATIGLPDLAFQRVVGRLDQPLPNFDALDTPTGPLSRNALVQSARLEITRSRLLLARAEAEPIPNVSFISGYQYTAQPTHNQYVVVPNFNIPIWNRNQGNILSAGAYVSEAAANVSTVQNDLVRQLADAMARYLAAQKLVANFELEVLPSARRALALTRRGYEKGEIDVLHYLQAQQAVSQALLDYIDAQEDRWTAAAEIAGLLQLDAFPGSANPLPPLAR